MPFPTDYLKQDGAVFAQSGLVPQMREWLEANYLVATRKCPSLAGQVARVQIDVYGESASEVEATLLEYATRCDAATERQSVSYGRCVIERNLEEDWGDSYSWRGRLVLHPDIGTIPSSERAAAAMDK